MACPAISVGTADSRACRTTQMANTAPGSSTGMTDPDWQEASAGTNRTSASSGPRAPTAPPPGHAPPRRPSTHPTRTPGPLHAPLARRRRCAQRIVVERHGGTITVDSRPGNTVLRVAIPVRSA
jgi:hypothetical protein